MLKILISISLLFSSIIFSQEPTPFCGTPDPTEDEIELVNDFLDSFQNSDQRTPDDDPVNVLVAWHVIHSSSGQGNIPDHQIQSSIDILNYEYNEDFNFYFTLDTITRHENDDWFTFEYNENANQGSDEQDMRSQTAIDPVHYYNIWSVQTVAQDGWITLGWNYFPFNSSEDSYWQGTTINYGYILGSTLSHEAGHYFGLFHTFQGNCGGGNDQVDDTPAMHYDGIYNCDPLQDTCPNDEGYDPVTNIMNYTNCAYDFTPGQAQRGYAMTEAYHPGLLENEFHYPNLNLNSFSIEQDTDGDGVINPGETANISMNILNAWGADADSILLTLSSQDERIVILDSIIQFEESLIAGEASSGPIGDYFEVYAQDNNTMGAIICNLNISSNNEYPYEINITIEINVNLQQYGFPIGSIAIKSSPVLTDIDNNLIGDIFFGADNGKLYSYMIAGTERPGFPLSTNGDIRSSPAVADIDRDGENEIIFGTISVDTTGIGNLYIISEDGNIELGYNQLGNVFGSPAIVDLDLDEDYEVVFTTQYGNSGQVYAIHHTGANVDGFPVDLDERMMVGAAAGDLEADGHPDIVVCTWDDHIYAIDHTGAVKEGFPVTSTNRFNAPPTLVDLDGDGDLEIVAGNDSGLLHVLHHDGSEMASYDVGDDIRGGISVADLNDDGSYELLFAGYDDMLHVWNPFDGAELEGFPIDMEYNSLTEPVTADLDNDGDLEVVAAMKSGMVHVLHHDGTPFNNFPTSLGGNIESSPAIGDLDNDGDFELIFGTNVGLKVLDIKTDKGERLSWKLHRGNLDRTGSLAMTLVSVDQGEGVVPEEFYVSPNYPNPFNPSTRIDIQTSERNDLNVRIFDATGRLVNTLMDKQLDAGHYTVRWNGLDSKGFGMPTGVYFIQVRSGIKMNTQKMILIK